MKIEKNISIFDLKEICQETRDDEYYQRSWLEKNISRKISILFTKLFLQLGISANQASFISFFVLIVAGLFFIYANPTYWIIGLILHYIDIVLDYTDGEIARYNKSASVSGNYIDDFFGAFSTPYIFACMSFGVYTDLQHIIVFLFAFIAIIFWSLALGMQGFSFIPQVIVVTIIDYFVDPIKLWAIPFSARSLYIGFFAVGGLIQLLLNIYKNFRSLQKKLEDK